MRQYFREPATFKGKSICQQSRSKLAGAVGMLWTAVMLAGIATAMAQSPPSQPQTGPGGLQAQFTSREGVVYGTSSTQFWIYTPQPLQAPAPVVVFMHGYNALTPTFYGAWIDHIVRRGNIVIFPRYQDSFAEFAGYYTDNAIAALKTAFGILGASADLNKVVFVGHSLGAVFNFNIASRTQTGLPVPKAILSAHPGFSVWAELESFQQIPASTLVLMLVGDADNLVGDATAKDMIAAIPHISRKNFITVQSDYHGNPPLVADHIAPNTPLVDALDYFAYWKLTDALIDLAFYGTEGDYAMGGGNNQTSMGSWSDGVPVKPLDLRPTVSIPGLINAASLRAGPISPGEMVILSGSGLGPKQLQPLQLDGGKLASSLSGTRVLFQGIPSPLVYSFMNQVAAVVPYGIAGRGSVSVQVLAGTYTSATVNVSSVSSVPGIFAANGLGSGQGTILNQNYSANSPRNPASKGSQIIIYATGEGELTSNPADGSLITSVLARTKQQVSITLGGVPAEVTYAGDAPGFFAGVLQVNVKLPANMPSGDLPVILTIGSSTSQPGITVAVK